ncbi:MAG: tRNA (adenosine(37)-N6)-dimethylallyltransferase MiaA [Pseudomonadota bacterium]
MAPAPLVLLLMGPTGTGKTALAMALADACPVHLISMDSAQVYRGLDIGSAKPDAATLARYPHALIDCCDPAEAYSAARFVEDADREVRTALSRGQLPVLVGGTMLYARAFERGLDPLPPARPEVRAQIAARAKQEGWAALHAELAAVDPQAAAGIHPNNTQRLQRALEVLAITGEPLSRQWGTAGATGAAERLSVRVLPVALIPKDRALLHRQLEARFEAMLTGGLIDEVVRLRARGDLTAALPAIRAVGYRQVWEHLEGRTPREELSDKGAAATRQLAKRQLTWLRGWPELTELPVDPLLAADTPAAARQALETLLAALRRCLAMHGAAGHSEFGDAP